MDEVVRFRMDADEKEALEAEAKKLGLSVSAFIRLLIKQWELELSLSEKVGIK